LGRRRRKGLEVLDRGAVLFIGIAVGTVLGLSLRTGGKPLRAFMDDAPGPVAGAGTGAGDVAAAVAPPRLDACGSAFPRSARVDAALAGRRGLHIGVFGDSFGDGVAAATEQAFRKQPRVTVHAFSHEGTGFTRYRTQDLLADARARIAAQPIDIAIISIGANDTQGLFVNGHAAPFMGQAWQDAVGGRIGDLVRLFQQRGVAVGWVGLPRMRDADFDRDIQAINAFQARVACKLGVPYADSVPLTQDRNRRFSQRLDDPVTHREYLARASDGKHMTFHGYEVISRPMTSPILALFAPASPPPAPQAGPSDRPVAPPPPNPARAAHPAPTVKPAPRPTPSPTPSSAETPRSTPAPTGSVPSTGSPTDLPTGSSTGLSTAAPHAGAAQ